MLLHHWLERAALEVPDKTAIVCEAQRITWAKLDERATRLAAFLHAQSIARGDRVVVFLESSIEAVVAIYAVLKLGAIFVPINPLTKSGKLAYLLSDSGARAVISQFSLAAVLDGALGGEHNIVVNLSIDRGNLTLEHALAQQDLPAPVVATIDQDLASIIYTSGSTGDAKGVMVTHLNMLSAARSISNYLGLRSDDVLLNVLPLAFDYGLYQVLMTTRMAATVVLLRSFAFPIKLLEAMQRERITVLPGVPTVFSTLLNLQSLPQFDLSALRLVTNTAAALSESHIHAIRTAFPQATLFSMYGLTECKRVSFLPPEELDRRPMSVGRGMPNEEIWLIDDNGERLPAGATGELVVRGSNVMRGYWNKPEETAERLRPGPYPGELLLHTGDLFRTDSEGFLYFVARQDDIIKTRGEKVSPREVENVLHSMDGILEAAVIGVNDESLGQAVKAFVVLKQGFEYTERDVIRYCLSRLEGFMAPRHVVIVTRLPRTDTGKISKRGLE